MNCLYCLNLCNCVGIDLYKCNNCSTNNFRIIKYTISNKKLYAIRLVGNKYSLSYYPDYNDVLVLENLNYGNIKYISHFNNVKDFSPSIGEQLYERFMKMKMFI